MSDLIEHKQSWHESFAVYTRPRIIGMFFLGFAAGLPFPLVFTSLSNWLSRVGVDKTTIGFFAWVGITYSIKVFWSPVVDRIRLPVLTTQLGQRRSWMLLAQIVIASGLVGMALTDPALHILQLAGFAVLVAFASATQDIAIDAYRIEAVESTLQGAMAATYQAGWRVAAALVGGAGALYIAGMVSWPAAYLVMAACISIGIITVLIIREPEHKVSRTTVMNETAVINYLEKTTRTPKFLKMPTAWFIGAVICPFTEFFQRNGRWAFILLAFISIYRISDIIMANMAHPLYVDLGFTDIEIANVAKIFGLLMTIVGAMVGGILVVRIGILRSLLIGAILVAATNLLFAQLSTIGNDINWLAFVISADNFSGGLAGSAFIAFLSRLTSTAYTATQYALFSSLMTLPAKTFSGFSGIIVDQFGFSFFFIYAACLGIPAILLVCYLMYSEQHIFKPTENAAPTHSP